MFNNKCMDMGEYKKEHMGTEMDNFGAMNEMNMPSMGMESSCCTPLQGMVSPIYECPQVRCCHREIIHLVPHIQPIETKIINHHIYKHTFSPHYTCCEENVACDVFEPPMGC